MKLAGSFTGQRSVSVGDLFKGGRSRRFACNLILFTITHQRLLTPLICIFDLH